MATYWRGLLPSASTFLLAMLLGGCLYSRHDLASELAPQFPMREGAYLDEKGAELQFEKEGGLYVVTNPEGEQYELAFFKPSDPAGYFVRLNPERRGGTGGSGTPETYAYGFADEIGGAWTFRLVAAKELTELPPAAVGLLEETRDDSGFGVRSEADTLRALETLAKEAELKTLMTLTPKP